MRTDHLWFLQTIMAFKRIKKKKGFVWSLTGFFEEGNLFLKE